MKNLTRGNLFLSLFITFFTISVTLSLAQQGDIQSMQGSVFCVELDDKGVLNVKEEWTKCSGTLVAVGADGKSYVISGTVEDTKMMMKQPDKSKTVSGIVSGHQRGWLLSSASAEHPMPVVTSTEDITVKGTIVCLLPNYQSANFKQVVATGPCNEMEQHLHLVQTSDGQVYAIHGSEDSIKKLEAMQSRSDVELKGKIQGEQGAWVLIVE